MASINRRSVLLGMAASAAAALFPEAAQAGILKSPPKGPWYENVPSKAIATGSQRDSLIPLFLGEISEAAMSYGEVAGGVDNIHLATVTRRGSTFASASAQMGDGKTLYVRHLELDTNNQVLRSATHLYTHSVEDDTVRLSAAGTSLSDASSPHANMSLAANKKCPLGECRDCVSWNVSAIITCCGGCAWAGPGVLQCAFIMCTVCVASNCTRRGAPYCCTP